MMEVTEEPDIVSDDENENGEEEKEEEEGSLGSESEGSNPQPSDSETDVEYWKPLLADPNSNSSQPDEMEQKIEKSSLKSPNQGGLKLKLTFKGHGQYRLANEVDRNSSSGTELLDTDAKDQASSEDTDIMEGFELGEKDGKPKIKKSGIGNDISRVRKNMGRAINSICGNLLQKAQSMSEGWTDGDSNPASPAIRDFGSKQELGDSHNKSSLPSNGAKYVDSGVTSLMEVKEEPLESIVDGFETSPLGAEGQALLPEAQLDVIEGLSEVGKTKTGGRKHRCHVCRKTFNTRAEVARHKSEVHNAKPGMFRCEKCDLSFSRRSWQAHMKEEHSGPTVESGTSGTDNIVWIYPDIHQKPSDRKYSIACGVTETHPVMECCFCCRQFHISGLHAHFLHAHPTWRLQYLCSSCGVQFKAIKTLSRHVQRFPTCSDSRCKSCGISFVPVTAMLNHVCEQMNPEHQEQRELQCRRCGKSYKQRFHLLLHSTRCKKDEVMKNECCVCSRVFGTLKGLERHLKSHSDSPAEQASVLRKKATSFKCNVCNKTFPDRLEKNRHRTQEHRTHVCPVCNEAFETKSKLGRHLVSHRTEKNYTCPLCDTPNRYRSEFCVRKHVRRCHADQFKDIYGWDITIKNFVCDICDKACLTRGDLAKHIRSHTNERPYPCQHCSSAFKQNRHLKEHMMYRHKEIYEASFGPIEYKHQCDQCDRKFLQSCTLKKHLRAHARQKMLESLKTAEGGTEVAKSIELAMGPRKRARKKAKVQDTMSSGELGQNGRKARPRKRTKKTAEQDFEGPLDLSVGSGIRPLAGVFVNYSMLPPSGSNPLLTEDSSELLQEPQWPGFEDYMSPDNQHLREMAARNLSQRMNGMFPPMNGLIPTGEDNENSMSTTNEKGEKVNHVSFSSMSSLPLVDGKGKKKKHKSLNSSNQEVKDLVHPIDTSGSSGDLKSVGEYPEILKIKPDPDASSTDGYNDKEMKNNLLNLSAGLSSEEDDDFSSDSDEKPDPVNCYLQMLEKGYDSEELEEENSNSGSHKGNSATDDPVLIANIKKEPEEDYTLNEPVGY